MCTLPIPFFTHSKMIWRSIVLWWSDWQPCHFTGMLRTLGFGSDSYYSCSSKPEINMDLGSFWKKMEWQPLELFLVYCMLTPNWWIRLEESYRLKALSKIWSWDGVQPEVFPHSFSDSLPSALYWGWSAGCALMMFYEELWSSTTLLAEILLLYAVILNFLSLLLI